MKMMRRPTFLSFAATTLFVFLLVVSLVPMVLAEKQQASREVPLPGGTGEIGFDDLQFSAALNRVLIPAGRTGQLDLVDPATLAVTSIGGFSSDKPGSKGGGHGEGITSVDTGKSVLYVTDRTALTLNVIDPKAGKIVSSAKLASGPDYVRYVAPTNEVWVTEPDADRIEVFSLSDNPGAPPAHAAFIAVKGGPESLVIDQQRGRAYTHLWKAKTVCIDLKSHAVIAEWENTCEGSRGAALEEPSGVLFVGCSEGKAVSLDVANGGKILSSLTTPVSGVDIIAFNSKLGHLYLPGAKSATMAIIKVSEKGKKLELLGTVPTAQRAHCVTTDQQQTAFVCDPPNGKILAIKDPY